MTRGSVAGPLIIIVIGVLFLIHTISPQFGIWDLIARYWPYLLIFWGALQILEISVRTLRGAPIPPNGISAGGWIVVLFICAIGFSSYEVRRPDNWWRRAGFEQGIEVLGEDHDYTLNTIQKTVGDSPRIVIESFRGDAKIAGTDSSEVVVNGHKTVQSLDEHEADRANQLTPVEVSVQGNTVTIRCNQDKSDVRARISTDLDISVPKKATIDATGTGGDFDISAISGDVDLNSDNAGVRLEDVHGHVQVDTRRSDLVRCNNIVGTIDLRGHGTDIDLDTVAGQVNINGDYSGTVSLRGITKPVRIENMRTALDVQQIPGELRLDRGSLTGENIIGPVKISTRATDITLSGFTEGLEVSVEKGDIDLAPARLPLGKMIVHTRSGNIDLALPQTATFALTATTDHGDIDNEFGDALKERSDGRGARLEGAIGTGPDLSLTTDRGSITVRKVSAGEKSSEASAVLGRGMPVAAGTVGRQALQSVQARRLSVSGL